MATPFPVNEGDELAAVALTIPQQLAVRTKASAPTHKALSAFDARLLNGAARGLSPNELSRSINGTLGPAECAVRVREMLADKAFWSPVERKQLLLHRVNQVVDDLFDVAGNSKDSQDYSALIRALDLARKTMSEMEGTTEAEMQAMVRLQAAQMVQFIQAALARAKNILHDEYPDYDPSVVDEAMQLAMLELSGDREEDSS